MTFGLTPEEFDLLRRLAIDPLKNKGAKVWIFGSRARGDQKKFSDVDILFEIEAAPLPIGFLSEIKESLENSRLPYKVDLVDSKELAESYKAGVLKDRVTI